MPFSIISQHHEFTLTHSLSAKQLKFDIGVMDIVIIKVSDKIYILLNKAFIFILPVHFLLILLYQFQVIMSIKYV